MSDKVNLSRKVSVRFTPEEYRKIEIGFSASTKRKISEYIRDIVLGKPITIYTRNQSLDVVMTVLASLKDELSAIGKNFSQVVGKLQTLERIPDLKQWGERSLAHYQLLTQKTEQIQQKINQLFDQWLQE